MRAAEGWERRLAQVEAARDAATARDREAQAKMDAVLERALRAAASAESSNIKQRRADEAAEYVRLRGANATLKRLRAEEAAEE